MGWSNGIASTPNTSLGGQRALSRLDPVATARHIRETYALTIPVHPEEIASKIGIQVIGLQFSENLDGLLLPVLCKRHGRSNREYVICVNSRQSRVRRRFSVAHELGHFFLHRGVRPVLMNWRDRRWNGDPLEREADRFAAELLMPADDVRLYAELFDFDDVVAAFDVSRPAMERRYKELGISLKKGVIA